MAEEIEFRKPRLRMGEKFEQGYYFNDEFLNRYKTKAIEILRKRITDAGDGDFQRGKDKAPEEWKVIHEEYLKSVEATKKTNQTKKPYWDKIHKRTLQRKITRLYEKIDDVKERKQDAMKEFDERVESINQEINEIKSQTKDL